MKARWKQTDDRICQQDWYWRADFHYDIDEGFWPKHRWNWCYETGSICVSSCPCAAPCSCVSSRTRRKWWGLARHWPHSTGSAKAQARKFDRMKSTMPPPQRPKSSRRPQRASETCSFYRHKTRHYPGRVINKVVNSSPFNIGFLFFEVVRDGRGDFSW